MKKEKIILLILVLLEVVSYFYYKPSNLEMFSFVWAFIFFVLLVYRWHGYGFNLFGIGLTDSDRYQNLSMSSENSGPRRNTKGVGKTFVFDIAVGLCFIANLLVSIIIY